MSRRMLSVLGAVTFAFLVWAPLARAQQRPVYVQVDFMKASSPDYEQVESRIWKPIHRERIRRGHLLNWALYTVRFGDRTQYDYMTVNVYASLEDVGNLGPFDQIVKTVHPKKTLDEIMKSLNSREVVRTELWVLEESLEMQQGAVRAAPGRYLNVALMKVPEGGGENYVKFEREIWKPIHQASLGKRGNVGWGVYRLLMPGGSSYPYNYAAVNEYAELAPQPSFIELVASAHPSKSADEIAAKTAHARELVQSVMWWLIDSTQ